MKTTTEIMTSSASDTWKTPPELFESLNRIFNFDFDACASEDNHLCEKWSSDVLKDFVVPESYNFGDAHNYIPSSSAKSVYCNPPYSKEASQSDIVTRLIDYALMFDVSLVMLLPARVETKLWQEVIFKSVTCVHFIKGRVKFIRDNGEKAGPATFPSALVLVNTTVDKLKKLGVSVKGETFFCGGKIS